MKQFFLLLLLLVCSSSLYSQKIRFEYDAAGNQILRTWCTNCPSRSSDTPIKDLAKLTDEDLIKFYPEDALSYYPNPVKEELYLQWEINDGNTVTSIEVVSLNGQILRSITGVETQNAQAINFLDLASGTYLLKVNYRNGDQKIIKIIKIMS